MARRGWLGLASVVTAYDTWAAATHSPTLSAQYKGAAGAHPALMVIGTAYLVLHLWDRWPKRLDPFCGYVHLVEAVRAKSDA